jgi:hypothetical protein
MTTLELYTQIRETIESAIGNSIGEVNIVDDSIKKINKLKLSPNINIQAGFCHQKPYAFFINPNKLYTKHKTELGDFLFVIKYVDNNIIIDKRALFFQAKYNKNRNPFSIEMHQFHFYQQIDKIEFKFGNSIYRSLGYKPIVWKNISAKNEFGDYFLIGDNFVIDCSTDTIASQYEHKKQGHFKFDLNLMRHYWHPFGYQGLFCKSNYPLFEFLLPFGKGNKIEGTFEIFINLIYKRLGMIPDPDEEHTGFWEENSRGGFGLIEITIDNNENTEG